MKKFGYVILFFLCSAVWINAQIKGKVLDDREIPIAFANVVLCALPDSAFIGGVVTDSLGNFIIHAEQIERTFLKISYMGYETQIIPTQWMHTIRLQPMIAHLEEVIVRGASPLYKMEANGLNTKIEHTALSRLGTAKDVLSHLPFLSDKNGEFVVFGRGSPLIYVNNRLVRDKEELDQLKSSEIRDVRIILNPGTEYESSVGSVIRIRTVKPVGEGWSGSLSAYVRQRRYFDHAESMDLNYRKGNLDFFGKIDYNKTRNKQNQKDETWLMLANRYLTCNDKQVQTTTSSWNATTGLNYSFSPFHSLGMRYNYKRMPQSDWEIEGTTTHFMDEENDNTYLSASLSGMESRRHYLNTYYHLESANQISLHFEGDYVKGKRLEGESSHNKKYASSESPIVVESTNQTDYSLYAGKIVLSLPVWQGKIACGGEGSYTDNKQHFVMMNPDLSADLPSTTSASKQMLGAAFLSFDRSWERFSVQAGLRYEYVDFKYYSDNVYKDDQSRVYHHWFPMLSVASRLGPFRMSLSSRTTVRRPTYFNLRSSISYNNPYAYEGGNPLLQPMYTHKITYLFEWKNLQVELSYNRIKNNLLFVAKSFEDRPISLLTMENLRHSQRWDVYVNYFLTVGWWKPTWGIGLYKQNLRYENRKYNTPYGSYQWSNIFQLPGKYQLSLNMRGELKGHSDVTLNRPVFRTDIKINKTFFANTLDVTFSVTDIFATNREKWSMHTGIVYFDKWNDGGQRGVSLRVSYKFNTVRNKYKGEGAGKTELNRL